MGNLVSDDGYDSADQTDYRGSCRLGCPYDPHLRAHRYAHRCAAPFCQDGIDIANVPVNQLCLPGHLLDLTHKKVGEAITIDDFKHAEEASGQKVGPGTALICWTGVDKVWGQKNMNLNRPYIPGDAAQWMVDKGITLFATDLIGMDNPDEWWDPTHLAWLSNNVCMVQQLCNLDKLVNKNFLFCAFPIKTVGGTGCPVRAVALIV
jgi:arylformamidase